MDTVYLIGQYLITLLVVALFVWSKSLTNIGFIIVVGIDFIVFPFVNYLWTVILNFIIGDLQVFYNIGIIYIIYKVFSKGMLFIFGFLTFPFAFFYIQYKH